MDCVFASFCFWPLVLLATKQFFVACVCNHMCCELEISGSGGW